MGMIKAITHKVEVSVLEMLRMLLTVEGEEPIELFANTFIDGPPASSKSRRSSVPTIEFVLPPGEKSVAKKKQQIDELRQEALELLSHFNRKMIDSLVRSVRTTLEKVRHSLLSPSGVSYGQASEKDTAKKPVLKLKLSLEIPSIVISPSLDDVQLTVNQVVQTILHLFSNIYLWGQLDLIDSIESDAEEAATGPAATTLASPSGLAAGSQMNTAEPMPTKTPELRTFYKIICEHKEIAKLTSALLSVISSAKTVVLASFPQFDVYKDLWQQEQEKSITEFMEQEPLLGDFEHKLWLYENMEGDISAEEDFIIIGPFQLDAS